MGRDSQCHGKEKEKLWEEYQIAEVFDQPKVFDGHKDDDMNDARTFRLISDWFLVVNMENGHKVQTPLPINFTPTHELHGYLLPAQESTDSTDCGTTPKDENNGDFIDSFEEPGIHGRIKVVIRNLKCWTLDLSESSRGIWVVSDRAWYKLQKTSDHEYPSCSHEPRNGEVVIERKSMTQLHLPLRALVGLVSNIVDIMSERIGAGVNAAGEDGESFLIYHANRDPKDLHRILSSNKREMRSDPSRNREPFDLKLLQRCPSFVHYHLSDYHDDLCEKSLFMKGLSKMQEEYRNAVENKSQWATRPIEFLQSAVEAELRSSRTPWGDPCPVRKRKSPNSGALEEASRLEKDRERKKENMAGSHRKGKKGREKKGGAARERKGSKRRRKQVIEEEISSFKAVEIRQENSEENTKSTSLSSEECKPKVNTLSGPALEPLRFNLHPMDQTKSEVMVIAKTLVEEYLEPDGRKGIQLQKLEHFITDVIFAPVLPSLEVVLVSVQSIVRSKTKIWRRLFCPSQPELAGCRGVFIRWLDKALEIMESRWCKSVAIDGENSLRIDEEIVLQIMFLIDKMRIIKSKKDLDEIKEKYCVDWYECVGKTLTVSKKYGILRIVQACRKAEDRLRCIESSMSDEEDTQYQIIQSVPKKGEKENECQRQQRLGILMEEGKSRARSYVRKRTSTSIQENKILHQSGLSWSGSCGDSGESTWGTVGSWGWGGMGKEQDGMGCQRKSSGAGWRCKSGWSYQEKSGGGWGEFGAAESKNEYSGDNTSSEGRGVRGNGGDEMVSQNKNSDAGWGGDKGNGWGSRSKCSSGWVGWDASESKNEGSSNDNSGGLGWGCDKGNGWGYSSKSIRFGSHAADSKNEVSNKDISSGASGDKGNVKEGKVLQNKSSGAGWGEDKGNGCDCRSKCSSGWGGSDAVESKNEGSGNDSSRGWGSRGKGGDGPVPEIKPRGAGWGDNKGGEWGSRRKCSSGWVESDAAKRKNEASGNNTSSGALAGRGKGRDDMGSGKETNGASSGGDTGNGWGYNSKRSSRWGGSDAVESNEGSGNSTISGAWGDRGKEGGEACPRQKSRGTGWGVDKGRWGDKCRSSDGSAGVDAAESKYEESHNVTSSGGWGGRGKGENITGPQHKRTCEGWGRDRGDGWNHRSECNGGLVGSDAGKTKKEVSEDSGNGTSTGACGGRGNGGEEVVGASRGSEGGDGWDNQAKCIESSVGSDADKRKNNVSEDHGDGSKSGAWMDCKNGENGKTSEKDSGEGWACDRGWGNQAKTCVERDGFDSGESKCEKSANSGNVTSCWAWGDRGSGGDKRDIQCTVVGAGLGSDRGDGWGHQSKSDEKKEDSGDGSRSGAWVDVRNGEDGKASQVCSGQGYGCDEGCGKEGKSCAERDECDFGESRGDTGNSTSNGAWGSGGNGRASQQGSGESWGWEGKGNSGCPISTASFAVEREKGDSKDKDRVNSSRDLGGKGVGRGLQGGWLQVSGENEKEDTLWSDKSKFSGDERKLVRSVPCRSRGYQLKDSSWGSREKQGTMVDCQGKSRNESGKSSNSSSETDSGGKKFGQQSQSSRTKAVESVGGCEHDVEGEGDDAKSERCRENIANASLSPDWTNVAILRGVSENEIRTASVDAESRGGSTNTEESKTVTGDHAHSSALPDSKLIENKFVVNSNDVHGSKGTVENTITCEMARTHPCNSSGSDSEDGEMHEEADEEIPSPPFQHEDYVDKMREGVLPTSIRRRGYVVKEPITSFGTDDYSRKNVLNRPDDPDSNNNTHNQVAEKVGLYEENAPTTIHSSRSIERELHQMNPVWRQELVEGVAVPSEDNGPSSLPKVQTDVPQGQSNLGRGRGMHRTTPAWMTAN